MKTKFSVALLLVFCLSTVVMSQEKAKDSPYDFFKQDVGTWDVKIKMWEGPGEPSESTGTEVNKMVGDFWLVSDFKADMMGQPFTGHAFSGYDEKTGKYVGTWIDSMNPNPTKMVGTYDAASKTLTSHGEGTGPDGNPMKSKMVVVYHADGTHTFTMFMSGMEPDSDEMMKVMEMMYTKKN